jgi:cell division protein FtsN
MVAAAPAPKPAPAVPPQTAKVVAAPGPAPPRARAAGGFLVQLGAVRTEAEAQALAAKAKRAYGAALAGRNQRIDRAVMGNMGAFYRVRFGPFGSAEETQAVCAKLRGSGLDCMPVSQ